MSKARVADLCVREDAAARGVLKPGCGQAAAGREMLMHTVRVASLVRGWVRGLVRTGAIVASLGALSTAHAAITALGNLPNGTVSSFAALSADGSTVVTGAGGFAYRWRAGAWTDLGNPGSDVIVHGVSGDGNVVTGAVPVSPGATVHFPRVWRGGSWVNLPLLDNPAIGRGIARTANADGTIVVGPVRRLTSQVATRWIDNAGVYEVGSSRTIGDQAEVEGVTADGATVVGWSVTSGTVGDRAFVLQGSTVSGLADGPNGVLSPGSTEDMRATAISSLGTFVAGSYRESDATGWQVWRRQDGGAIQLLGAGEARDISALGLIVAGPSIFDAAGTMWTANAYLAQMGTDLSMWAELEAMGVSDDGLTFAGMGLHRIGPGEFVREAWIATIPGPSTVAALVLGLVAHRRRMRR